VGNVSALHGDRFPLRQAERASAPESNIVSVTREEEEFKIDTQLQSINYVKAESKNGNS
jgi:hypothetical protein